MKHRLYFAIAMLLLASIVLGACAVPAAPAPAAPAATTAPAAPAGGRPVQPLDVARRDALRQRIAGAQREEHGRQTAAQVEEAVREALEVSWGLPVETPLSQWRARLEDRGAPAELVQEVERLVPNLRYLRFAPQLSSPGHMKTELCARACRLIDVLGS